MHSCGYDSIPSDLGVLLLHERAVADGAGGLTDVQLVATVRGGFSGGTIDSVRAQIEAVRDDRPLRSVAGDPYALSPDRAAEPDAAPAARRGAARARRRRHVDGAVRDGVVQHPDRAAQQRAAGLGLRPRACATAR